MKPANNDVDNLAYAMSELDDIEIPDVPHSSPTAPKRNGWLPKLGPMGHKILSDPTQNILLHGERGSLKSAIGLHKLVLAMYENVNNLGVMYTLYRGAATEGGIWEKLITYTLPEWHDGIGIEFSDPKQDDQKNRHIFVSNKHGGWARIVLKSAPPGTNLSGRMKGQEPGFVLFDEIAEAEDPDYFHRLDQQLRRPNIPNPQFVGTCNPPDLGDLHWLYPLFFTDPAGDPEIAIRFKNYHVPIGENVFWSDKYKREYQQKLITEARGKGDQTIIDRLVYGKWVARPLGNTIFSDFFLPSRHSIGDMKSGVGLRPRPGFPVIVSYDIGPAFTCVTFTQAIPHKDGKIYWLVFDEVDHFGERILYRKVAWEIIERMKYWRAQAGSDLQFMHITDESAINQWRAGGEGSYDAWEFEKEFNKEAQSLGFRSSEEMPGIKLIGCPKGNGSREARVTVTRGMLANSELFVSAICSNTTNMFMQLPEDPNAPGCPLKRSKWSHKFDSLSYGLFYFKARGTGQLFSYGKVATAVSRVG